MTIEPNSLINTEQSRGWLETAVNNKTKSIDFCSAYIKTDSVNYFFDVFGKKSFSGKGRFLTRWRLSDLIQKSSDIEIYNLLKEKNFDLYMKLDFHGKIYKLNPGQILMGSPNMTNSGFGLINKSNDETGVILDSTAQNDKYIENLFLNATLVTDVLFKNLYSEYLEAVSNESGNKIEEWSINIQRSIIKPSEFGGLLVNDCFFCNPSLERILLEMNHDLSLLGLKNMNDIAETKNKFIDSKFFKWFISQLVEKNGELYFGEVSELLHNVLIDDPKPYRKDVKGFIQNFLGWVSFLDLKIIEVDRPNHSQRIKLI